MRTSRNTRNTPTIIGRPISDGIERSIEGERFVIVFGMEDVPWKEDPSVAFPDDIDILMDAVDIRLHESGEEDFKRVSFNDNRWVVGGETYKFNDFPADMAVKVKKYVLFSFISHDRPAYATVQGHLDVLRRFYREFFKMLPYKTFLRINTDNILESIEKMKTTSNSKMLILEQLEKFYSFLMSNYPEDDYNINMKLLNMKKRHYATKANKLKGINKRASIPEEYFLRIQMKCIEVARNSGAPYRDRVTACVVLLFSWLGLRPNEVPWIKADDLNRNVKNDMEFHTVWYRSPKNGIRLFEVYCFPMALEAFRILQEIRKRCSNIHHNEYLIVYGAEQGRDRVSTDVLNLEYTNFLITYLPELTEREWPGLEKVTGHGLASGKKISRPSFYTYRVHLFNYLCQKGFDIHWIERNMGHIAACMKGYYYRTKPGELEEVNKTVIQSVDSNTSGMSAVASLLKTRIESLKNE